MASGTFSNLKSKSRTVDEHHEAKPFLGENVRGVLIVVVGSLALIGAAYGAMVVITGPDGWAAKVANTATGQATPVTYADTIIE